MANCCIQITPSQYISHHHPCPNQGKYKRGEKWYCGTHDPVRRAAREEIARKKREVDNDMRDRVRILKRLAIKIHTKDLEKYKLVLKSSQ